MKNENHIVIHGWMVNKLDLSGNDLIVYALIYGFAQDGVSQFYGSLNYISSSLNSSRKTAINVLDRLIEKNLITKEVFAGVKNIYHLNYELVKKLHGGGVKVTPVASEKSSPDNTSIDNIEDNLKGLERFITGFNATRRTKYKPNKDLIPNFKHWMGVYTLDEMLKAVKNCHAECWLDKDLSPTKLLRQKNVNGNADYIGELLNLKPKRNNALL